MATYTATYEPVDQVVLMRVFRTTVSSEDPSFKRYQSVAKRLISIQHKNLLSYMDYGTLESGMPYIIQEQPGKNTLGMLMRINRLPTERASRLFGQACLGLQEAHEHGCIHESLTPHNCFVDKDLDEDGGEILRIGSFSLVSLLSSLMRKAPNFVDQLEFLDGNCVYMSPEQCMSEPMDGRSDIYSLGCMLYEALSGQTPFATEDAVELSRQHAKRPAPPILEVREDMKHLPSHLPKIVHTCLEKEPTQRYQFTRQLRNDLIEGKSGQDDSELSKPLLKAASHIEESFAIPVRQLSILGMVLSGGAGSILIVSGIVSLISLLGNETACGWDYDRAQSSLSAGRPVEGFEAATKSLSEAESIKPPGLPLMRSLNAVARAQIALAKYPDAEKSLERALEVGQKQDEPSKPTLARCIALMSRVKLHNGDKEEAEQLARKAESIASAAKNAQPDDQLITVMTLADVLAAQQKFDEAQKQYDRAKTIVEQNKLKDTGEITQREAVLAADRGDLTAATDKLSTLLFSRQKELGTNNPLVADTMLLLAEVHAKGKKFEPAEKILDNAFTIVKDGYGEDSAKLAETSTRMAKIYEADNKMTEAEKYYRLALDTNEKIFGNLTPAMVPNITDMGRFLRSQGNAQAAEVYESELKEIRAKYFLSSKK